MATVVTESENISVPSLQVEPVKTADEEKTPIGTYIFIGVLSLTLIFLLYYAYGRFVTNTISEPMTKGQEQERDDPVIDFNLREAIRDLNDIQKKVVSTLSEAAD